MNLGGATVGFGFGEDDTDDKTHYFQVQEFRRPEFEITTSASEAPHFVGSSATVTMTAGYYSGGGLADTEVDWTVQATPTNYTPPNRGDYTFGEFLPWWSYGGDYGETKQQSFKGRTDANGKHTLRLDFDSVSPARPSRLTVNARVQDVNRQTIAAYNTLLVHPADVYVGLKSARSFVQKGDPFDIATIVTDLDGKALSGREVRLRLVRLDYVYEKGEWKQQERDVQEQTVKSGADAVSTRFKTTLGGMYRLTAQVRDERERLNESELSLWVAGGKLKPIREVTQEKVELIPDRRTYAGNDVAEILGAVSVCSGGRRFDGTAFRPVAYRALYDEREFLHLARSNRRGDDAKRRSAGRSGWRGGARGRSRQCVGEFAEASGVRFRRNQVRHSAGDAPSERDGHAARYGA